MKKTIINLAFLTAFFLAASCAPEQKAVTGNHNDASSTAELTIPHGFDWKASHLAEVVISPEQNGVLIVQDGRGAVYHKAFVKSADSYSAKFSVPAGRNELFIYFQGGQETFNPGSGVFHSSLK